ncbi:phage antirepressor KilAC domain-containing protein [Lactococcus sp. DD01]|uniref:phage antirepressor KilAC domain-containing protein n=1 Tax=Lactococcus sp. DD01 TaxID=1776443 RepID=UPI0007762ED5|nr:phage antirepressor KilAC domain-containing protein [Lactococcus sp. DD01]KXT63189.1 Phage antirepressor protein [Lactococcus sp. DD01]
MNELITVTQNSNNEQVVSARELHNGLGVKTRFSLWVTQNFKMFKENIDFSSVVTTTQQNQYGGVKDVQDYALSVEMAKHIAMMAGTSKGFEFRDYFIQVEKAWNSEEMILMRSRQILERKVLKLETENAEMKPKAIFADSVATSQSSILVGQLAKIICQSGYEIGQNRLFAYLRENGWLGSRKGEDWNMPTQKAVRQDLLNIKESIHVNPDGSTRITKTPKVTGKGQIYFVNKFLKDVA